MVEETPFYPEEEKNNNLFDYHILLTCQRIYSLPWRYIRAKQNSSIHMSESDWLFLVVLLWFEVGGGEISDCSWGRQSRILTRPGHKDESVEQRKWNTGWLHDPRRNKRLTFQNNSFPEAGTLVVPTIIAFLPQQFVPLMSASFVSNLVLKT